MSAPQYRNIPYFISMQLLIIVQEAIDHYIVGLKNIKGDLAHAFSSKNNYRCFHFIGIQFATNLKLSLNQTIKK